MAAEKPAGPGPLTVPFRVSVSSGGMPCLFILRTMGAKDLMSCLRAGSSSASIPAQLMKVLWNLIQSGQGEQLAAMAGDAIANINPNNRMKAYVENVLFIDILPN